MIFGEGKKKTNEKRRCIRFKLELPATFKAIELEEGASPANIHDFSAIGICFTSKDKVTEGQELEILVNLPDGKINIFGKVMWVKEKVVYEKTNYTVGVKITDTVKAEELKFVKYYADKFMAVFNKKEQ